MAGRSEVIAILSSGVSYKRFMLPFMVGGLILCGILWAGYQYVVPNANKIWGNFDKKYVEVNKGRYNANNSYKQNIYFKGKNGFPCFIVCFCIFKEIAIHNEIFRGIFIVSQLVERT